MTIAVKICGLSRPEVVQAAATAGAAYIGFVFYAKSPRHVTPQQAAGLATQIPASVIKCGVFVDPTDEQLDITLAHIPLDLIQLHGTESTGRLQDIKTRFKRPVMKAIAIAGPEDITAAKPYQNYADMLLFDAKAPTSLIDALPGGNGLAFDWQLIKDSDWQLPWMLSGGLNADNLATALAVSGAKIVDVSSGVELSPGVKDIAKINAFIQTANKDSE